MTKRLRRPRVATRPRGEFPDKAAGNGDGLLVWHGTLPRFSPMREGGPGRPLTLVVIAAFAIGAAYQGMRMVERDGIDGAGPALMLIGATLALFLALWILIKAGLRGRDVTFVISDRGVGIRPSRRQAALDRRMGMLTRAAFLLSWKGGQWSAWTPFTEWKRVRRVTVDKDTGQILIAVGAWDIRLVCTPESFDRATELVSARAAKSAAFWRRETMGL